MNQLRELYQQVILDHYKNPRNFRQVETANRRAEGYNPLCGDHYTLYVELEGDVVKDIGFQGSGCAISKASASVMSSMLKGKTKQDFETMFKAFQEMVKGGPASAAGEGEETSRLAAFAGVSEHPSRIKCATLAWHTLNSVFNGEAEVVSTEEAVST